MSNTIEDKALLSLPAEECVWLHRAPQAIRALIPAESSPNAAADRSEAQRAVVRSHLHGSVHQAGPEGRVRGREERCKCAEQGLANIWVLVRKAAAALLEEERGLDDACAHNRGEDAAGGGRHVGLGVTTTLDYTGHHLEYVVAVAVVAAGEQRKSDRNGAEGNPGIVVHDRAVQDLDSLCHLFLR